MLKRGIELSKLYEEFGLKRGTCDLINLRINAYICKSRTKVRKYFYNQSQSTVITVQGYRKIPHFAQQLTSPAEVKTLEQYAVYNR